MPGTPPTTRAPRIWFPRSPVLVFFLNAKIAVFRLDAIFAAQL